MDPITTAAIIKGLGDALGAAFGPRPQKHLPYGGRVSAQSTLEQANDLTSNLFGRLANQGPVRLRSSFAQPVPGLSGVDPAYNDRSLLDAAHPFDSPDGGFFPSTNLGGRTPPPGSTPTGQSMPRDAAAPAASAPARLDYNGMPTTGTPTEVPRGLDARTQAAISLVLNHSGRQAPTY